MCMSKCLSVCTSKEEGEVGMEATLPPLPTKTEENLLEKCIGNPHTQDLDISVSSTLPSSALRSTQRSN
ncbi:hypothetical protein COEREDRAFT_80931, partial [Coemansia reversa NRRL 1564]